MPAKPIPLATEYGVSRSRPLNDEMLENLFVERQPPQAKSQAPLFGAPGLAAFATCGASANRGGHNFLGVPYFVQGADLYSVDASGTASLAATGITGTGPVDMDDNGTQICIVTGAAGSGYVYTVAGGLVEITDDAFYPANTVTFMDGYFIFDRAGTNEFFLSALYDGLAFNGLDFATAEAQSGMVMATQQNLELLFIFTTSHIEIWYDAGTNDFPFQRYAGGVIPYGTDSSYANVKQDGAIFFLGADQVVYRLQANVPIRISSHPVETAIDNDDDLSQAGFQTYTIQGHKMVVMQLEASLLTLVFDISTGKWHKRRSVNTTTGPLLPEDLKRWRGASIVEAYQQVLVADIVDGRVGLMDWDTFDEYGNLIVGRVRSSPLAAGREWMFVNSFELDIESGVGNTVDPGADPHVMLRYSRNGGRTWSMQQPFRSMGLVGEYGRRLRWWKQGRGLQWEWELTISGPVKRTLLGAFADIDVGL